jgi:hypothetical protein
MTMTKTERDHRAQMLQLQALMEKCPNGGRR